jgi:hypothetical protein
MTGAALALRLTKLERHEEALVVALVVARAQDRVSVGRNSSEPRGETSRQVEHGTALLQKLAKVTGIFTLRPVKEDVG